jgi:type I restriction enzyme S subunit
MSFPAYPSYKLSGIEWLGEAPRDWSVLRLGDLFKEVSEAGSDDLPILSVSIHDGVSDDELAPDDVDRKVTRSEDKAKYKKVQPSDLVYNMMRAWQGGFGAVRVDGMVSPAYVVARPKRPDFDSTFVEQLLRTENAVREMKRHSQGVTDFRLRLYWQEFKNCRVALPPLGEQRSIVAFIDHETAKIDALVSEQQRLIELLKEKRQAVISHAVTKGLDPNAPMKDIGVEWIGEVPAHWSFLRLKVICEEIVDCKNRTPDQFDDGEYFVVRTSCIRDGVFSPEGGYLTNEASFLEWTRKGTPQAGDILFTREAPAGEACLAPRGFPICLGQRMMYLRPNTERVLPEFVLQTVYGPLVRQFIDSKSKGSTVGHLRVGEVGELPVLLPPLHEQKVIVDHINAFMRKADLLNEQMNSAIALLQERRSALISAAVTGKIDVRGLVAAEAEAA